MKQVIISDKTLRQPQPASSLSFREKIEVCKMMDRLGADIIELGSIVNEKADSLLIKAVSMAVRNSTVAVTVPLGESNALTAWNAVKDAPGKRLQVSVPVSSVQMEYLFHMKPAVLISTVSDTIIACRRYTDDVEFIAEDATRSDPAFLRDILNAAVTAGARTVTICDTAGQMLPDEFSDFVENTFRMIDSESGISLGIDCRNTLHLAEACAISALSHGVSEIKAAAYCEDCIALSDIVHILANRKDTLGFCSDIRTEELDHIIFQINKLCSTIGSSGTPFENGIREAESDVFLTGYDSKDNVIKAAERLGYDLSEEDMDKIWNSFGNIIAKKGKVTLKELDALIATEAMQVPPVYKVISYVINTGSMTSSMAHMTLSCHDHSFEGISLGDGTIDAAFLAIEKATGKHYELDDFQIQAIAEGREAMGETIVKLRSNGKLYSGRGISTDIVGASIMAYINALNKIAYEEDEA